MVALVGGGIGILVGADMAKGSEAVNRQAAPRATSPFVGPDLPNAAAPRECYKRIGAKHGLTWTDDKGWRADSNPALREPLLTFDLRADRAAFATWKDKMDAYIAGFAFEFEPCLKPPPPENPGDKATTSHSAPPKVDYGPFTGTYNVEVQSQSATCLPFPNQLAATVYPDRTVEITVTLGSGSYATRGPLNDDGSFDISATEQRDISRDGVEVTVTTRVRGRFDRFGTERRIRSGFWEGTIGGTTCAVGFEALA